MWLAAVTLHSIFILPMRINKLRLASELKALIDKYAQYLYWMKSDIIQNNSYFYNKKKTICVLSSWGPSLFYVFKSNTFLVKFLEINNQFKR